jgi:hypothetical protein
VGIWDLDIPPVPLTTEPGSSADDNTIQTEQGPLPRTVLKVPISCGAHSKPVITTPLPVYFPIFQNRHHCWVWYPFLSVLHSLRILKRPTMPGDNSSGMVPDVKREEVDPPQSHFCHGSGEIMPQVDTSAAAEDCGSRSSPISFFTPRPFPPPSLAGVPIEYIVGQLRALAPQYWDKPETADCTICASPRNFLY